MKSLPGRALLLGLPLCLAAKEPESIPLSLETDANWYGIDGKWSAVNIYVGSELATVSLFPSTVDRGTWLVGGKGCENSSLSDCPTKRGALYHPYSSSTWKSQGERPSSRNSSIRVNYGTDSILVDWTEVCADPLVIVNETDTWVGLLGLAVDLGDHNDLSNLSLMEQALFNRTIAPSGTYGYTAGAHYRMKGVPASLTIGGVDQHRYTPNSATFHLTSTWSPVVSLNTISISSTEVDKDTLTHHEIIPSTPGTNSLYTLDSSTSYIWLPEDAFDTFGRAFNLTYDDNLGFYTYGNDTSLRQRLLGMGLSLTFSISDLPDDSQNVNITLPLQAFDHSLAYPFPNLPSEYSDTSLPYIPVRKASTPDEQRIGRVFFQEAYLAVDYEKKQFSLYQASFDHVGPTDDSKDIVPIDSYLDQSIDDLLGNQGLSKQAKVGIGVGTAAGSIIAIAAGVWVFLYFRNRRAASEGEDGKIADDASSSDSASQRQTVLDDDHGAPHEMASDDSHAVYELPGSEPAELDARSSFIRHSDPAPTKTAERHIPRHSETQSSIAASLSSHITETSDGEGPAPTKGYHTSPPSYTPQ